MNSLNKKKDVGNNNINEDIGNNDVQYTNMHTNKKKTITENAIDIKDLNVSIKENNKQNDNLKQENNNVSQNKKENNEVMKKRKNSDPLKESTKCVCIVY